MKINSAELGFSEIKENIVIQKQFVNNLNEDLKELIKIRLPNNGELGNKELEKSLWDDNINSFNFEEPTVSFKNSMKDTKIVIVNSLLSTVFFDFIGKNVPIFLLTNFNKVTLDRDFHLILKKLTQIGVAHKNPKLLSSIINKNFNDIEKWWFNHDRQKVLSNFRQNYTQFKKNSISELSKIFTKLL